jgi:hypothetical protein
MFFIQKAGFSKKVFFGLMKSAKNKSDSVGRATLVISRDLAEGSCLYFGIFLEVSNIRKFSLK